MNITLTEQQAAVIKELALAFGRSPEDIVGIMLDKALEMYVKQPTLAKLYLKSLIQN